MMSKILSLLSDGKGIYKLISGFIFYIKIFPFSLWRFYQCRNKLCVCFDYSNGIYAEFYLNIYLKLKQSDQYETILLTSSISPQWNYDDRFEFEDFIPNCFYKCLKKKIVIHATSLKPIFLEPQENTRHIQMNHGFGSFIAVLDESYVQNVDMFFANTEHQVQQLKEGVCGSNIKPRFIKRIGYPKIDGTIKCESNGQKNVQSIFYGPTYHVEISSIFSYLKPLIQFCVTKHIQLYIKLHPFLRRKFEYEKSGGIDWEDRIQQYSNKHSNIELVPTFQRFPEIVDYFNESDIFMTDNSGFGYEYVLITGKPIVFLGNKLKIPLGDANQSLKETYEQCPEIYYRGRIGPTITDTSKFDSTLENVLDNELSLYGDEIKKFRNDFTFHLGNASEYAVQAIHELADDMTGSL